MPLRSARGGDATAPWALSWVGASRRRKRPEGCQVVQAALSARHEGACVTIGPFRLPLFGLGLGLRRGEVPLEQGAEDERGDRPDEQLVDERVPAELPQHVGVETGVDDLA